MQKYTKEIFVGVMIAVITGAFTKINYLEKEVSVLKQSSKNSDTKIEKLEVSRENLSNYYVTRREFNQIIEAQNKKLDNQEVKLDKIIDIVIKK